MKKTILALLAVMSVCSALAQEKSSDANLRIGSYNLRMQNLDKNTPDNWTVRRSRCMQSIWDNEFDIFGVQEMYLAAQKDLASDLGKEYACTFFSPYNEEGVGDKASGIVYRKKRFKMVSYHYFWIYDNPDEMADNDHFMHKGTEKSYRRGGACATFKDKKTGKMLFFMNIHGILNNGENLKYAHVLVDMEKKYNPQGYPSFLVGDFNARVAHPSHQVWREHWNDSADLFGERQCTMNSFNTDPGAWEKIRHIDFIYYRNIEAPVNYMVNQTLYDGRCASDHFPIYADFVF